MSLSDRRRLILGLAGGTAASLLSGCFRPMLAEGSDQASLRGRISLPEIDGRFGYFLYRSLEDRLGKPDETEWMLEVQSRVTKQGFAVAQDNSVTRFTLTAVADWKLRKRSTGKVVLSERSTSQSGFSATTSPFATRQTEQDIERRLARDIGERISRRIYARAGVLSG